MTYESLITYGQSVDNMLIERRQSDVVYKVILQMDRCELVTIEHCNYDFFPTDLNGFYDGSVWEPLFDQYKKTVTK